ncbi:hypothetical protein BMS3Abin12_01043 [bacterium BMS3Abin12]|nr:hypothetical protein BMS3Abin12_01043 [bacterium BMS3Abin12]
MGHRRSEIGHVESLLEPGRQVRVHEIHVDLLAFLVEIPWHGGIGQVHGDQGLAGRAAAELHAGDPRLRGPCGDGRHGDPGRALRGGAVQRHVDPVARDPHIVGDQFRQVDDHAGSPVGLRGRNAARHADTDGLGLLRQRVARVQEVQRDARRALGGKSHRLRGRFRQGEHHLDFAAREGGEADILQDVGDARRCGRDRSGEQRHRGEYKQGHEAMPAAFRNSGRSHPTTRGADCLKKRHRNAPHGISYFSAREAGRFIQPPIPSDTISTRPNLPSVIFTTLP